MDAALPPQIFIRNQKGLVWGPLSAETVELMIDNGILQGQLLVSKDGLNFGFPSRFPEIRDFIPRELWGDGASPAPAPASSATPPAEGGGSDPSAPAAPRLTPPPHASAAPMAGPGAVAAANRQRAVAPPPGSPKPQAAVGPRITAPPIAPTPAAAPRAAPAPPTITPAAAAPTPAPPPKPSAPEPAIAKEGEGPPPNGDLAKTSPIHLYYLAGSTDATGLLRFQLKDRLIEVHFRKGNPEYVASDHADDALGAFLLQQRLTSAEQLAKAEAEKGRFGGELVGALFGLGVLNPTTAFAQLTQRAQSLLLKGLLAEGGSFSYEVKELPPQKAMPLGNRWAVLSETVRQIPVPELQRRLRSALDLPIMKSGGRVPVADLRLSPRETRALSFIDGVRSLNQLAKDLPADQENFLRVAFLLQHLESVSFASVATPPPKPEPAAPPPPAPAAKPAPAATAKPATPAAGVKPATAPGAPKAAAPVPKPAVPVAPAAPKPAPTPAPVAPALTPEAELPQLRAFVEKMRKQNHFELLGLTDKADGAAVKVAYFKMAKIYHPDTVPPGAPEEYGKLKAEIFGAVGEANRRLADDKSRAEYVDELKHGAQEVDVAQIFIAEELFQKACILVKARKFPEAVAMLDDAIKANADEGEFYAWRGYARFFSFKDKAQGLQAAVRDIQMALKKNERCAQAHFFHGSMAKLCGDNTTALKEFKMTIVVQPDHVDAQRELRLLAGKK